MAYGLRVNGVKDNEFIRHRVEETLKGAALWDEVKNKLKESAFALSGGQQQRLCIARAMAVSPSVLLMDEPASALDPISTAKVEELIHELKKEYTIVIVTHNMQQAARVSDKTAFFYMGNMVEYDDTKKIFTNPGKEATQNYITGTFRIKHSSQRCTMGDKIKMEFMYHSSMQACLLFRCNGYGFAFLFFCPEN